jgi:hypothetical protein
MRSKIILSALTVVLFQIRLQGQIGGLNTFEYVKLPVNAYIAALGGINVSVPSVNMVFQNPALISADMSKTISLSYLPYYAGVKNSAVGYVHEFNKIGPVAMGIQYFSSGSMNTTDETGNQTGTFSVNQYFINAATSHKIRYYTLGLNVKLAGSQIDTYSSYAFLTDVGGVFKHPSREFTIGLVVKNMGFAIKKYETGAHAEMPFDIQVGTTYKLEHMPFRVSFTAHHLHQFDIVYLDPNKKGTLDEKGEEVKPKKSFADKLGRHFILGGEFLLGKHFSLQLGYNYLRRRELKLETSSKLAGFSFGAMIKIKSFELFYSRAYYYTGGATNNLTVNASLHTILKKKNKTEQPQ